MFVAAVAAALLLPIILYLKSRESSREEPPPIARFLGGLETGMYMAHAAGNLILVNALMVHSKLKKMFCIKMFALRDLFETKLHWNSI